MQSARVPCSHRWCPRVPLEPDLPWLGGKGSACPSGDKGSIPGWGRFPGGGQGNLLNRACQATSMVLQRARHSGTTEHACMPAEL